VPLSHFAICQYLHYGFELDAYIDISFKLFAVIFMHAMNDGLPADFIALPPFLLCAVHASYNFFARSALGIEFVEIYCAGLDFADVFEIGLKSVELAPVLNH
jgi:hypothetical protein